ncbi:MAG: COX15/CtaA family protein [Geminicoccaceae bacterium]
MLDRNSPWSVAVHLGNALLVLTLTLRILAAQPPAGGERHRARPTGWIAAMAWGLALLAMMSAAMTAKSGASLACATWPSCNGSFLPDLADEGVRFHCAHRLLAAGTALSVLALLARAWLGARGPAGPPAHDLRCPPDRGAGRPGERR